MSRYYLMSQLPSLDAIADTSSLPITEERFYELCERFLPGNEYEELKNLTLVPDRQQSKTGVSVIDEWNSAEGLLRLALANIRAGRLKKSFEVGNQAIPVGLLQAARAAVEIDDPFEAEKFLNKYRLDLLETLRPFDAFSKEAVVYYALKLKLVCRINKFDKGAGEAAYKTIYNSILNGGAEEVAL